MNVLKPHLESTVMTLLRNGVSQREICRKTGVDRKTIRKIMRNSGMASAVEANSPTLATGSVEVLEGENPPPRPPAATPAQAEISAPAIPQYARSACEDHREWIEAQVSLGRNAMAI